MTIRFSECSDADEKEIHRSFCFINELFSSLASRLESGQHICTDSVRNARDSVQQWWKGTTTLMFAQRRYSRAKAEKPMQHACDSCEYTKRIGLKILDALTLLPRYSYMDHSYIISPSKLTFHGAVRTCPCTWTCVHMFAAFSHVLGMTQVPSS